MGYIAGTGFNSVPARPIMAHHSTAPTGYMAKIGAQATLRSSLADFLIGCTSRARRPRQYGALGLRPNNFPISADPIADPQPQRQLRAPLRLPRPMHMRCRTLVFRPGPRCRQRPLFQEQPSARSSPGPLYDFSPRVGFAYHRLQSGLRIPRASVFL